MSISHDEYTTGTYHYFKDPKMQKIKENKTIFFFVKSKNFFCIYFLSYVNFILFLSRFYTISFFFHFQYVWMVVRLIQYDNFSEFLLHYVFIFNIFFIFCLTNSVFLSGIAKIYHFPEVNLLCVLDFVIVTL